MNGPVVFDKATRALSLETIEVPGGDGVFEKAALKDNTAILVRLEAMRNLVNLNIRQREDSSLSRTPDIRSEKKEMKRYLDKLQGLVQKLGQPVEFDEDRGTSSIRDSEIHELFDKDLSEFIDKNRKQGLRAETLLIHAGQSQENYLEDKTNDNKSKTTKLTSINTKTGLNQRKQPISFFKDLFRTITIKTPKNEDSSTKAITKYQPCTQSDVMKTEIETDTTKMPQEIHTITQLETDKIESPSTEIFQNNFKESAEGNKYVKINSLSAPNKYFEFKKLTKMSIVSCISPLEKETVTKKPSQGPEIPSGKTTADNNATPDLRAENKIRTIGERISKETALEATKATITKETRFTKLIHPTFGSSVGNNSSESKSLRFLIYGYIKSDKQPLFLIQPYEGDSLLGGKKILDPKKSKDGIDILVSGKFYSKNILEEENSLPKYLTVGNKKIIVDDNSKIFFESITGALITNELGLLILIKGSLKKHISASCYTPSLFIGVEKKSEGNYNPVCKKYSTKKRVSNKEVFFNNVLNIPTYTIETIGFTLFPTRTEGGIKYETSPLSNSRKRNDWHLLSKRKGKEIYKKSPRKHLQTSSKDLRIVESKTVYAKFLVHTNNAIVAKWVYRTTSRSANQRQVARE